MVAAGIGKPAAATRREEENTKEVEDSINLVTLSRKTTFMMKRKALDETINFKLVRCKFTMVRI